MLFEVSSVYTTSQPAHFSSNRGSWKSSHPKKILVISSLACKVFNAFDFIKFIKYIFVSMFFKTISLQYSLLVNFFQIFVVLYQSIVSILDSPSSDSVLLMDPLFTRTWFCCGKANTNSHRLHNAFRSKHV